MYRRITHVILFIPQLAFSGTLTFSEKCLFLSNLRTAWKIPQIFRFKIIVFEIFNESMLITHGATITYITHIKTFNNVEVEN